MVSTCVTSNREVGVRFDRALAGVVVLFVGVAFMRDILNPDKTEVNKDNITHVRSGMWFGLEDPEPRALLNPFLCSWTGHLTLVVPLFI